MPVKVAESPYPLIDTDPHAFRVVRYMRPSDYAVLAGGTAAGPGMLWAMGQSSVAYNVGCPEYGGTEVVLSP